MKVEYPLQLFHSFNKRIWNNKPFSYFLMAFVIGYTIVLRSSPQLYYKYMMNPVLLTIVIAGILIISVNNLQLGLLLVVSLIALYYPKQKNNELTIEESFDNQISPIDKHDKNIVDDDKKKKSKKLEEKKKEKDNVEEEEKEDQEEEKDDVEEDFEDEEDEEEDDAEENKISEMRLENLNPSLYKKKKETPKSSNNSSNKSNNSSNNSKKVVEKLTDIKKKTKTNQNNNEETFLGEVRQIVKDLDTGKNKMNATSAIKKISNLMYHKHKGDIQKIINTEESEEEESDEEYY